jgi:polar amino acid transport system substrate-binding protein
MKTSRSVLIFMMLTGFFVVAAPAPALDTYDEIMARGVLIVGVNDRTPSFGNMDPKTNEIIGYDVDFAKAMEKRLNVKLQLKPILMEERIPKLLMREVDMVAATFTRNAEREKLIDFSYVYFYTGQKFLVKKGTVKAMADLNGKRIGTSKETTSEENIKKALKTVFVVYYDDYLLAFEALRQDKIFAVTTDESILASILSGAADKGLYEIPDLKISHEPYAFGVRKGNKKFLDFLNKALLEMEKSGESKEIFNKWFGPDSPTPLRRPLFLTTE